MNETNKKRARDLAVIAQNLADVSLDYKQAFDLMVEGIKRVPEQLQMMVDSIVAIQNEFPMPEEGWESFLESIEYTNEKHGLNLHIKPELFD